MLIRRLIILTVLLGASRVALAQSPPRYDASIFFQPTAPGVIQVGYGVLWYDTGAGKLKVATNVTPIVWTEIGPPGSTVDQGAGGVSPWLVSGTVAAAQSGAWSVSFTSPQAVTQSGTWSVRTQDGSGNALASSTSAPAGTEQALIVRNIPSGTQNSFVTNDESSPAAVQLASGGELVGVLDGNPTGTEWGVVVRNIPSGTQPVSGAVTVSGTVAATQSGTWNIDNLNLPLIASFTSSALSYEGDPDTGIGVMPLGLVASGAPSYSNGNMAPIRLDTAGAQVVSGTLYAAQTGVWSLAANQSVNIAQMNGVTTTMGNGASGTGVQRVTIADDSTGLVKLATGANTIGALTANQSVNTAQFGGTNVSTGTGAGGAGIPRVTISNDSSLAANQSVNVAQMNGVTTSMGVGASGTGTQRVASLIHDGTDTALVTTAGALNADVSSIAGTTTSTGVGASGAGTQRVAAVLHDGTDTAQVTTTEGGALQAELVTRANTFSISSNESVAAPTAAVWYLRRQWAVPASAHVLPTSAWATVTTAASRTLIGVLNNLGNLNLSTNTFTAANSVASPFFYGRLFGCVTTVMSATADTITPTYTDELGNSQATVGVAFASASPVGNCYEFPLATASGSILDSGVRAVTAATDSAAPTGVVTFYGVNTYLETLGVANALEETSRGIPGELNANEQLFIMLIQAATTAQQRGAGISGTIR